MLDLVDEYSPDVDELPGARDALELYGRNDDGWPPLVDAIADRFGVPASRVATAPGASGRIAF